MDYREKFVKCRVGCRGAVIEYSSFCFCNWSAAAVVGVSLLVLFHLFLSHLFFPHSPGVLLHRGTFFL